MIGVIGGMGPLATADFFRKVIECTSAEDDAGHVPLLISSDPRIPPRPAAILAQAESPLPALRTVRDRLLAAGVQALVMPCNTAHCWHADLLGDCPVPFPSIVSVSAEAALARQASGGNARVGLIATRATLAADLFEPELARRGLQAVPPSDDTLDRWILPAIAWVKAGRVDEAQPLMAQAVERLLADGADFVLLACTEAPLALAEAPSPLRARAIDTTLELARHTVELWGELRPDRTARPSHQGTARKVVP
jgi:aspartate racemase